MVKRYFDNSTTGELIHISNGNMLNAEIRNIFGYQIAGDITLRPLWEFAATDYVYPPSAIPMTVTAADVGDNGKLLLIKGLDENYAEISDTVTLVGLGDVITNIPFFRINDVVLLSGTTNAGLITVQNALKTIKYAGVRAGDGRSQASIYTVPAGKDFFLFRIDAFSSDTTAGKPAIFQNFSQTATGQQYNTARTTFLSNMNIQRRMPFKYNEKTDIQFRVATRQGTHELSVFGEGILLNK